MISFADLVSICKRGKSKILFGMLFFSLLATFWTLTNPVEYIAEGTFKDKARASGGLSSLSGLLFGNTSGESDAIMLMKSRAVAEELVKRLGMQARISRNVPSLGVFETMRDQLVAEAAIFKGSLNPSLQDPNPIIGPKEVAYNGEVPKAFSFKFLTENTYELYEGSTRLEGTLEVPLQGSDFKFTLTRLGSDPLRGLSYNVLLLPLNYEATNLSKIVRVEPDRLDRNLLNIKYGHRDRHHACQVVATLGDVYKDFLRKEQDRIIAAQVAYLEKRQSEIGEKLKQMVSSHILNLSDNRNIIGFANTSGAMEYLTTMQNQLQQKLLDIEFESRRLQKMQNEKQALYDSASLPGDPAIINHLLTEMRNLKQQGDWIDLALRNAPCKDESCTRQQFEEQLASLDLNRIYRAEANQMLSDLEEGVVPEEQEHLMQDPKYLVKAWLEKLASVEAGEGQGSESWQNCCAQLSAYLTNLVHHFDVYEKAIQERLANQQSSTEDFQGVDLETARELYIGYSRQLNDMEAQALQYEFIAKQIEQPDFEVSALSTLMSDPVSGETVMKASRLALELKDYNNRSLKEQERIRDELGVQKRFLTLHLKNATQLLTLKAGLIETKIGSLRQVMMGLIQQQVSLLEKHLKDYIAARIQDLKQESAAIEERKNDLRSQVATLPSSWASEMLIDQQIEVNKKTAEEVAKLVESKVIGNNIEIIQSTMIDKPVPPIHPKSPRLIFFAVLGAFMGGFLSTTFLVARELVSGIQASRVNLELQGQHVAGNLSPGSAVSDLMTDENLDTMRRLTAHLCPPKSKGTLLLVKGRGPDYSSDFATLLAKQGLKVLVMQISFNHASDMQNLPGLLQYLEGQAVTPKIQIGAHYDTIAAGGISRYSNELLNQERFQELLQDLAKTYEWIVAVSDSMPASGEVEGLLNSFDCAALTITHEKLDDLKACMNSDKKSSFVLFN